MNKYSFKNDYSEGCHQNILQALASTNMVQQSGYGDDQYCIEARNKIKEICGSPNSEVFFVSGGTQANLIVISSILKTYETVIAAQSGHINKHEAAAIEATGHRIESIQTVDGKLRVDDLKNIMARFEDEHTAKPRLVYISDSTELGTIYKLADLESLSKYCKSNGLLLFMDGARLGSALTSVDNDISFKDLSRLIDVFYIGATKNGGLIGEAIVINNPNISADFKFYIKQRGALLAKGRLLGIQFLELFKDDLYLSLARTANELAAKISTAVKNKGFSFLTETSTNQIFPILQNKDIEKLSEKYEFYVWEKVTDETSAIRLVTSWATSTEKVEELVRDIDNL